MIRINLLGEKVDYSGAYLVHGVALAGAVCLAIIGCFVVHGAQLSERDLLANEKMLLDTQLVKLREKTKKVENLDAMKKLLQEKLMTIARLKTKKSGPVHLLSDISSATPERSWLTAIRGKSDSMEFKGVALDAQTVSAFMTQLAKSEWIGGVELQESKQIIKDDVPTQSFTLVVKNRNPLDTKTAEAEKKKKAEKKAAEAAAAKSGCQSKGGVGCGIDPAIPAADASETGTSEGAATISNTAPAAEPAAQTVDAPAEDSALAGKGGTK